jgi:NAD(P)-dependent dehydrogenase (short-subunit alcohol dehydrogenase family)
VELLLSQGARVSTCARTEGDIRVLREGLQSDSLHARRADITRAEDRNNFVTQSVSRFGPIYGLVNNAGEACVGHLHSADLEEFASYLHLKLVSTLSLIQCVLPHLTRDGGSIVNIAGAAGVDPTALLGIAGVANAGLRSLSRTLADELADRGVRVNTVNPGTLNTRLGEVVIEKFAEQLGASPDLVRDEMYGSLPLGRVPTALDVARCVAFFLSDDSAMLTGAELTPDGGTLIRRLRG